MHLVSCYHCGCRLAPGAIAFIFPTDTEPAPSRPDQFCRCSEIVDRWSEGCSGFLRGTATTCTLTTSDPFPLSLAGASQINQNPLA